MLWVCGQDVISRAGEGGGMSEFCCGPTDDKMKERCSELSWRELRMRIYTRWRRLRRRRQGLAAHECLYLMEEMMQKRVGTGT